MNKATVLTLSSNAVLVARRPPADAALASCPAPRHNLSMGLSLEVGILADLADTDPEGAEHYEKQLATLNEHLAGAGLPGHQEPRTCSVWSAEMFGYSGLHHLRRLAAHVDAGGPLPPPGDDASAEDPTLGAYVAASEDPGLFLRAFRRRRRVARGFDHLILHSDAEGFYLPADFDRILVVPGVAGEMVGSVPRLLAELERLARLLEIPSTLDEQSDALWEAADNQGEGDALWQRYGIESFSCVVLREGCRASLRTGAALVFT
jgi:hypothetical protein